MSELERHVSSVSGEPRQQYFHRYALAASQVTGLRVLDIGSGDGYGSAILAESAASVDGIEDDDAAASVATARYGRPDKLNFYVGRPERIPFGDEHFDAVVAFDFVAAGEDPHIVLREVKRVLKSAGLALISAPTMRFGADEFTRLLATYFKHQVVLGQRMAAVSSISPTSQMHAPNSSDYRSFAALDTQGSGPFAAQSVARLPNPDHIICLVSDTPLAQPEGADSIVLSADQWSEHSNIMGLATDLHDQVQALEAALIDKDVVIGELQSAQLQAAVARESAAPQAQVAADAQAGTPGLPLLSALASDLAGQAVGADVSEVARSLAQAAVRQAVQSMRLAEAEARLTEAQAKAAALSNAAERAETAARELDAAKAALSDGQKVRKELEAQILDQERALADHKALRAAADAAQQLLEQQDGQIKQKAKEVVDARALLDISEQQSQEAKLQLAETLEVLEQMRLEISGLKTAANAPSSPVRPASMTTAPPKAAPRGLRERSGRDVAFSEALDRRVQQSIVDQIAQYRSGLSAAVTVRGIQRELAGATVLSQVAITAAAPLSTINTGTKRPVAGLKGVRETLKQLGTKRPEIRDEAAVATLFDPDFYVARNNVKPRQGETPFDHYCRSGRHKGLSTHPLIDSDWISATWPEGRNRFDLFQYLDDPSLHDLAPHPLFDAAHYRRMNQDVAAAGLAPLAHYSAHGWREGREPNQLFSPSWYLSTHQDVLECGAEPLRHYLENGAAEGRQPHPLFDRHFYLEHYPDIASSGMEPYAHFIAYGRNEGRAPSRRVLEMDRLNGFFNADRIIDVITGGDPERRLKLAGDHFWPPIWDGEYWLPQRLRDLLIDRYGEERLDLFVYLFSLIERYGNDPGAFDHSPDAEKLIQRARSLASVPVDGQPTATIVIPVYNNLLYTLTCIVSVLESAPRVSFEILVADDLSSDRTPQAINAIGGVVKHIRHSQNLGFLGNCNAAAHKAAGSYIVLLNNDTIVLPGWLENLIEPMMKDPEIGFTGSKLLNGDGTLQEAGGIFWSDGSAWNYGRDQDSMLPAFNYQKDVDYISGASIALPMALWRKMGGFDPVFSPAYCEDSDLAFRVRQAGYRTVYQPHSALVHHEGRSHGRDTASGIKAYQVINQEKLLKRWGPTLQAENFPNGTDLFLARDRSRNRPHILIVDHYLPQWDQDAGSRTMFHFIRAFVNRGFQVTFWPDNLAEDREYAVQLQRMGVEVIYGHQYVNRFDEWLAENSRYLDYVLLSRPHITERYIDAVERSKLKTIYYGHDLHCMRARSAYDLSKDPADLAEAEVWEARELGVCQRSDVVMYPGIEEIAFIRERLPSNISVLRPPITIFDEDDLAVGDLAIARASDNDPFALMFVGGFAHSPNGDGVDWFLSDIWPRLIEADSRFSLKIAGSRMPESLRQRNVPGVTMLGRLSEEELADLYANSGMVIVPLRFGGGIKGKVIEAFAKGVPVAMTDIGAQGIPDAESLGFVTAADHSFADAILEAARNRAEALQRAARGVDFLRKHYSEQAFCDLLEAEIPQLSPYARPAS